MVCYSHLFQNFPQFIVIHTVKGFGIVNKAEIDIFCLMDYAKDFDCVDHNKMWKILKEMGIPDHLNSEKDGNTRLPGLPLEKPICKSGSNSHNWTWNNTLVPNRKRSTLRLYIVTLLI